MRSPHIRPTTKSIKVLAVGALLIAGAAGCTLSSANAADAWTATTKPEAQFECVSNCSAGGVGPVRNGVFLNNSGSRLPDGYEGPYPGIGRWSRTVAIQCKTPYPQYRTAVYRVEVRDNNWAGLWQVHKDYLAQAIDDTGIPNC